MKMPCPMWRSPHCPSIRKREDTTATPPAYQGTTKAQLFVHGCVFWLGINKAIEETVQQTCTWFQARMLQCPSLLCQLHPTHADGCHGHLYLRRNQLPDMWQLLFKDDPHLMASTLARGNTVKVVSLLKEMFLEHGIPKVLHSNNGHQYASA